MYGRTRDRQKTSYNDCKMPNDYPAIRGVPLVTQHHWRKILGRYRQGRRRGAAGWSGVLSAGALAIARFGRSHWSLRRTRLGYGFSLDVRRLVELFCSESGPKERLGWGVKFSAWFVSYRFLGVRKPVGGERRRG